MRWPGELVLATGVARARYPLQVEARAWAPEAERLDCPLRRSGAGCRVCEVATWRAVLAGGLQGAPTQRASGAPRSRCCASAKRAALGAR